jgi:plasmid maintenance system antidote protein VapI
MQATSRIEIKTGEDIGRALDNFYVTQTEFARMAGVDRSDLGKFITGRRPFGRLVRIRLQKAADILAENPPEIPVKPLEP